MAINSQSPWLDLPTDIFVYRDERYTVGQKDGVPFLTAGERKFTLSCHPYEPCLYIKDESGSMTAVHNSFDPSATLELFYNGRIVTSITGREYTVHDFCRMVEYAAGLVDVSIDDAERVFGAQKKKKEKQAEERNTDTSAVAEKNVICDDTALTIIDEYPDSVVDFCIVKDDIPYNGYQSHWRALVYACGHLLGGDDGWHYNMGKADAREIAAAELFSDDMSMERLTYRRAFLKPPYETDYTDADFDRINTALFPNGTDNLIVYEWTTDWSDYFDEGHEWWGALCVTVYDVRLDRFIVIMASSTD